MTRGGKPRPRELIAYHHAEISKGYLQGETQDAIAKRLGLSQAQVSYDLQRLVREWQQEAAKNVAHVKGEELQRLKRVETQAWEAWRSSKQPSETSLKEKAVSDGVSGHTGTKSRAREVTSADDAARENSPGSRGREGRTVSRVRTITRTSPGDPRYLQAISKCIELRLRLAGLWTSGRGEVPEVSRVYGQTSASTGSEKPDHDAGMGSFGVRLGETLKYMRPEDRTYVLDQFDAIVKGAYELNQQLLALQPLEPITQPDDEDAEDLDGEWGEDSEWDDDDTQDIEPEAD